jgi:hypothetical protein
MERVPILQRKGCHRGCEAWLDCEWCNLMVGANDDTSIENYWHEWEIRGAERQVVLCVETALELDPGRDGFDRGQLDELLHQASKLMQASPSPIDFIRIVPAEN